MASRRGHLARATRCRGRPRRPRGPARSLVAVCPGDARLHGRVGVAPAPGPAVTTLEYTTPIQFLKGVGPKRAESLQRLGVRTVGDLLYHVPHRYLDATTVTPLAHARGGACACSTPFSRTTAAVSSAPGRGSRFSSGRSRPGSCCS